MTAWAGLAGAGVAMAIARKLRKIMAAFEEGGATRPEMARTLTELGLEDNRFLRRLQTRGVVVTTADHRFYLDKLAMAKMTSRRRTRAVVLTTIALVAVLLIIWLERT